jgi:chaperone required for assembly of F1-ATPase
MLNQAASRFYKLAKDTPCDGGFQISLDERSVNTPLGKKLVVPSQALAQSIAEEWEAQEDKIVPDSMHCMRLACTAIDKVVPNRANIVEQTVEYGANDLLCYRAEAPDDLAAHQSTSWQPLLDWAESTYGSSLKSTQGILHIRQDDEAISSLRQAIDNHSDFELTALTEITQILGSLVLGLAVSASRLNWEEAFDLSQLDESWQNEQWGQDHEALLRHENRKHDMKMAAHFLGLVRLR